MLINDNIKFFNEAINSAKCEIKQALAANSPVIIAISRL